MCLYGYLSHKKEEVQDVCDPMTTADITNYAGHLEGVFFAETYNISCKISGYEHFYLFFFNVFIQTAASLYILPTYLISRG